MAAMLTIVADLLNDVRVAHGREPLEGADVQRLVGGSNRGRPAN
jgi:hypothetical protein